MLVEMFLDPEVNFLQILVKPTRVWKSHYL